jgi:hypothetical protein
MAVDRLPGGVREFADYLNALLTRLDQGGGWCGVFWQRDPEGMRACLDGREVPPWDVVEALLHDLGAAYGPEAATGEAERAQTLHGASLAAYDARPGGRDALGHRLDVMLREQRRAADRQADLGRRLGTAATREEADSLRLDLAWAHDDQERATARCAELRRRLEALDHRPTRPLAEGAGDFRAEGAGDGGWPGETGGGAARGREGRGDRGASGPLSQGAGDFGAPGPVDGEWPGETASTAVRGTDRDGEAVGRGAERHQVGDRGQRSRRRPRGSARFAGVMDVQEASAGTAPAPATSRRGPRGARFAGAAAAGPPADAPPRRDVPDATDRRLTAEIVAALTRLRAEGRSGEAHALLVEAAHWPPARYPLLADALHRAGLHADWTTLLWEAASLSVAGLVAAADALTSAGRTADGEQMLRQGVVRPAGEIGEAVLGLSEERRHREVRALLDVYVRARTPEEVARSAAPDPQRLVPLLLEAARGVSDQRHWDLVHALRVAGLTA